MPDIAEDREDKQKIANIEVFLRSLMTGAKTVSLYKSGHPIIQQISERVVGLLAQALGQDTTLTLDIKAKSSFLGETQLPETPEIVSFSAALHTLGVGQILFTNRITKEGMYEFFRVLTAKADEKNTLTDIQKSLQTVRIDGLQMVFILSFVVTGEEEEPKAQTPGQLTEEQISAYLKASNAPDFLYLLLKQNEPLVGKEAEAVTDLLDRALHRDIPIEVFEKGMPWDKYDARILEHWKRLAADIAFDPEKRWRKDALITRVAFISDEDLKACESPQAHEKKDAIRYSLDSAHELLEKASGDRQPKYVLLAYVRLLAELSADGNIDRLLKEFDFWRGLGGAMKPLLGALQEQVRAKLLTGAFAGPFVARLSHTVKDSAEFKKAQEFVVYLGDAAVPLLLEELRSVQDKGTRQKLCSLLAGVGKTTGTRALLAALKDPDWFLVSNVVTVLLEIGNPEHQKPVSALLQHAHQKVREAAVRAVGKFGGANAATALGAFIAKAAPEEAALAVTTLSLLSAPGVDEKLIAAFDKVQAYETKVAIAACMGRVATNESVRFLKSQARRSWYEILTKRNHELRQAARQSLEQLKKDGKI